MSGAGTAPADAEITQLLAVPLGADGAEGVLVLANRAGGFDAHPDDVLLGLGQTVAAALEDADAREELRDAFLSTVAVLAEALEAKDRSLLVHAARPPRTSARSPTGSASSPAAATSSSTPRSSTTWASSRSASASFSSPPS